MSTPTRSIWFGVLITSKVNGKENKTVCILHLHFEKRVLNVVKKGSVEYTAEFGMIESVDKDADPLALQTRVLGRGLLDIRLQSEDDRDLLWRLLEKIVSGQDNTVTESLLSSHNAPVLLSGWAQKKGSLTWSKRFLVLHKWGLLVYRNSSYQNSWPLNIIILENAIFTAEGQVIIINTKFRDYRLNFDKDKVETWLKAFNQLASLRS